MDSEFKSLTSVETEYLSKSGKKRRQKSFIKETSNYDGSRKEATTSILTTTITQSEKSTTKTNISSSASTSSTTTTSTTASTATTSTTASATATTTTTTTTNENTCTISNKTIPIPNKTNPTTISESSSISNLHAISGVSPISIISTHPILTNRTTTTTTTTTTTIPITTTTTKTTKTTTTKPESESEPESLFSNVSTISTTNTHISRICGRGSSRNESTRTMLSDSAVFPTTGIGQNEPCISNETFPESSENRLHSYNSRNQNRPQCQQSNTTEFTRLCELSRFSRFPQLPEFSEFLKLPISNEPTNSTNPKNPSEPIESTKSNQPDQPNQPDQSTQPKQSNQLSDYQCSKLSGIPEPTGLLLVTKHLSSINLNSGEENLEEVIRQLSSINIDSDPGTSEETDNTEIEDTEEDSYNKKYANVKPRSFILDLIAEDAEEELDLDKEYKSYAKKDDRINKTKNKNTDKKRVRKRGRAKEKETTEPILIDEEIEFVEDAIIYDESKDVEFPELQQLFREFNETFFNNQLSSVEVKWSNKMKLCAGICVYKRSGYCCIRLSLPLLKLRKIKEYKETLLHEMIHAYLFLTRKNASHDGHGPEFKKHMYRINKATGLSISIYHSFHDEVNFYRSHVWRCNGVCRKYPPQFGFVRRSMNRPPGPKEKWWRKHQSYCNGKYIKVEEKTAEKEGTKKQSDSIENAEKDKMKFDEWKKKKEQDRLKQIESNKKRNLKNIKKRNGARVITRNDGVQDAIIVLDSKDFRNKKKIDIEESGLVNLIQSLFTDHASHVRNVIFKNLKDQESTYPQKKKEPFSNYNYTINENNYIVLD